MSNEVYHVLGASIRAAKLKLGCGTIIVVKKQSQGKTHTVKAIEKERPLDIMKIPPGTETATYDFLRKTNALVYYIDDKDKWSRDEFSTGVRYIKLLSDGEKAPLKANYYSAEAAREPERSQAWAWILLNINQLDAVNPILTSTGIESRAIYLRSKHSDSELKRIKRVYRNNKWNYNNGLPLLKKYDDWYYPGIRTLSDFELDQIESEFKIEKQTSIEAIASVMSESGFAAVFGILASSCHGTFFEESIEFDTRKKIMLT